MFLSGGRKKVGVGSILSEKRTPTTIRTARGLSRKRPQETQVREIVQAQPGGAEACRCKMAKQKPCIPSYAGSGGRGWIRTTEALSSRFTVCPHWPLGNTPIFTFVIRRLSCQPTCLFYHSRGALSRSFFNFLFSRFAVYQPGPDCLLILSPAADFVNG